MGTVKQWLLRQGKDFYLSISCAYGYEDQVPELQYIKWYDIFWFLIPIAGMAIFDLIINSRCNN